MNARRILLELLGPLLALLLSFLLGAALIWFAGKDPLEVYGVFFSQTLGTWYGIGQVLFKATPLIFTGISTAIGFRAGLFNIGADGQLVIGALCTAIAGVLFGSLPAVFLVPLCLAAGILGGALWGFIPGVLKARFGAHEVINTIMMNFIAAAIVSYLVNNFFAVPATVHTREIAPAAELPRLDILYPSFRGSPVNFSLLIALLAAALMYYLLWRTRLGYELRAIGLSPTAAEYGRVNVHARTIVAMTLAGGFAGLVGSNFVMGYKHYYELGFSESAGFIGIAVALLGKNHPAGIVLAALFFGVLEFGGLTINGIVPKELVNILQAVVILLVIILGKLLGRRLARYA